MDKVDTKKQNFKKLALVFIGLMIAITIFLLGPIPQDPQYHFFADTESVVKLPHFWNVISNLPFLGVGIFALLRLTKLANRECQTAYTVLSLGIMLVAFGSAYYHYNPSNASLLWDRLPMTIAFMALFSIILGERVITEHKNILLWFLVICGISTALYWSWTESRGIGDLRPYVIVQFLPVILMPIIVCIFPAKYLSNKFLVLAVLWYLLAKLLEHFDHEIKNVVMVIGGHPLKHVAAGVAALCLVRSIPASNTKHQT